MSQVTSHRHKILLCKILFYFHRRTIPVELIAIPFSMVYCSFADHSMVSSRFIVSYSAEHFSKKMSFLQKLVCFLFRLRIFSSYCFIICKKIFSVMKIILKIHHLMNRLMGYAILANIYVQRMHTQHKSVL